MILIDRSIPRSVADALALVRDDVEWLEPRFAHDTPDEHWLAEAGRQDWVVVTRDKRIRTRPRERQAINENGTGCFILAQRQVPTPWVALKIVVPTLDEMVQRFAETPRPFIFMLDSMPRFRQYL